VSGEQKRSRTPLVFATARARQQAEELGIGVVEVAVEQGIAQGRKSQRAVRGLPALGPGQRWVHLDDGFVALVAKSTGRLTSRKALTVRRLYALPNTNRKEHHP
jgi:hypothetical protein